MTATLQEASQQQEWTVAAKLVNKMVFVKKGDRSRKMCLVLVFIDSDGQPFEIKTWSRIEYDRRKKIFTVYRKVSENEYYEIQSRSSGYYFRAPRAEYSTSKLEYTRGWWIDPSNSLRMNRYLDCSTNLQSSVSTMQQQRPVNLLGSFISYKRGPPSNIVRGKPAVQGYFVTLSDDIGRIFVALVWHSVNIDRNKFSLFHANKGDTVLLFSARLGRPQAESSKDLTLVTSIYQPVVNSKCVSPKRINALKGANRSSDQC